MTAVLEGVSGHRHAPAALYPRERPGTHFTRGWVGPRAGLEGGKSRPHRDSIPDRLARSQSLYRLSYPARTRTHTHTHKHTHTEAHTCVHNLYSQNSHAATASGVPRILELVDPENGGNKFI